MDALWTQIHHKPTKKRNPLDLFGPEPKNINKNQRIIWFEFTNFTQPPSWTLIDECQPQKGQLHATQTVPCVLGLQVQFGGGSRIFWKFLDNNNCCCLFTHCRFNILWFWFNSVPKHKQGALLGGWKPFPSQGLPPSPQALIPRGGTYSPHTGGACCTLRGRRWMGFRVDLDLKRGEKKTQPCGRKNKREKGAIKPINYWKRSAHATMALLVKSTSLVKGAGWSVTVSFLQLTSVLFFFGLGRMGQ